MHLLLVLLACNGDTAETSTPSIDSDSDSGVEDSGEVDEEEDTVGTWSFEGDTVTVTVAEDADGLRSFVLTSTHPMRDGGPSERTVTEQSGDPKLRSGILLTDALFAMAVDDARLNAVSQISDGAFAEPVDCECYQTGEQWSWVWTRDIAYAVELGLAWLDPDRAARSLMFKLSEPKGGGPLQIVQDTGTGGSWPVSTDRVAWARGAMAVLRVSDQPALREAATEAMRSTAEIDRKYAYDERDGLYRGETSFLDWREQSYPAWTEGNVVHIGMSKSLSTNLDHLFLLRSLESLTGEAHGADDLAAAIDATFWDGVAYRSYTTTGLDPAPARQQDLLATSFAVLDLGTHPEALAAYPQGPYGPPVIAPQQQLVPIYHNRGIWPFVTAYSVLAARAADNGAAFDAGIDSLVRGAALNLSHMENLELATGANYLDDGDYSGPVVNSRRQLWSVAGFLGAVAHGVFGVEGSDGTLTADPLLPSGDWFLPGATLTIGTLTAEIPAGTSLSGGSVVQIDTSNWQQVFGARTPDVSLSGEGETVTLSFSGEEGATFDIFRDGEQVAEAASSPWSETVVATACYTVVAKLVHSSQPSEPVCWWGDGFERIQSIPASAFIASGGAWSSEHGRDHYGSWGAPDHTLTMTVMPTHTGEHLLQLVYGNGSGPVDTGVTAAVKWVTVVAPGGAVVAEGSVVMPHMGDWSIWADSSLVPADLDAGVAYAVTVSDGFNMSYLAHYEDYVAGRGGGSEPSNDVNIAELKLLFMR
jgi:hypothetical protein